MSILAVERLSKNFRGLAAINDVSFAIEAGSITSIIGPNGAGKSTMFNLITGYLPLTAGEIRFRGQRITGMATNRIAELGIARAFQIARPFRDLSVFENVRIGALFGKAGPRDVEATTHRAWSWRHRRSRRAAGEQPDRRPAAPSRGRPRHRDAADLLLADEPCAGLNPTETAAMIDVLRQIRTNGVTVVLVEHDMPSVMEVSDRILVLDAGRLIADGSPKRSPTIPRSSPLTWARPTRLSASRCLRSPAMAREEAIGTQRNFRSFRREPLGGNVGAELRPVAVGDAIGVSHASEIVLQIDRRHALRLELLVAARDARHSRSMG